MLTIRFDSLLKRTPLAALFLFDEEEVWLPLSQIELDDNIEQESGSGTAMVADWLVEDKGLDGYLDE